MGIENISFGMASIIALTIFIVGMTSLNFIKPEVTRTRSGDETGYGLDCTNKADFPTGISAGNKLLCLAIDLVVPVFIIIVFSVAGGIITARFLL